jgi:Glycosyl hydrolase family 26
MKYCFHSGHKIAFHAYSTKMTLVLVYFLALYGVSAQRLPVNPLATEATARVLEFFFELRDNDQLLLGQDLGHGSSEKNGIVSGYQKYVETLHTKIGKYVGFIGGDYGLDPNGDIEAMNTVLINHHKKGGIVTISWHFYNPWTGGDVWDTNKQENLWELLETSTCTSACRNWQRDKNNVAKALSPLRDAGVPVLWCPFHEMNGD